MEHTIPTVQAREMIPPSPEDFGDLPALDETFTPGSFNCLIGAEPEIKDSYIMTLSGMVEPVSGVVTIGTSDTRGITALGWKKLRTEASMVSGFAPLLSIHHGLMNVMLPLLYHNAFKFDQASERARAMLKYLECDFDYMVLPAFMDELEQRVISLARGLITRPRVLFLHDFFRGLVTSDRRQLYRLLERVKDDYNLCIIASLGDLGFNWSLCDRVVFVSDKKTITRETWNEIITTEDPDLLEYLWDESVIERVRPKHSES